MDNEHLKYNEAVKLSIDLIEIFRELDVEPRVALMGMALLTGATIVDINENDYDTGIDHLMKVVRHTANLRKREIDDYRDANAIKNAPVTVSFRDGKFVIGE